MDRDPAGSDNALHHSGRCTRNLDRPSAPAPSRPLTIAYASPGWPPAAVSNGIATYVEQMRTGLAAIGHRPLVFTGRVEVPDPPDDVLSVTAWRPGPVQRALRSLVYRIQGRRAGVRWHAESLRRSLLAQHAKTPIDLLEIEETFGFARHLIGRVPFPVVVKMHGAACVLGPLSGEEHYAERWRLRAEAIAIQSADGVCSPSQALLDNVQRTLAVRLEGARVLPNPTSTVPKSQTWRREACDPEHILFVGRFDRTKGADLLVDAFKLLLQQRPDARLTMIGPDPGVLDAGGRRWHAREYIEQVLPDPRDQRRVEFLGSSPHERLNDWRRRAAVVVVPSRYENFPNAVLEAAGLGAPIVAADAGGIPEIITHGENGRLFKSGDAASLATELLHVLADPAAATHLGEAARESCERRLCPDRAASIAVDFYREVIANHERRR